MLTSRTPLVSVIIDTYYRPDMLRHAVSCLCQQTYRNLEIILVNNGATPETVRYLAEVEKIESRVKLVHFVSNQFSWDDPLMMIRVCLNAGLNVANGDLVFYQSDDDWVATDYIERMVALFLGNPACTTAKGRCVCELPDGTQIPSPPATRGPYIAGIDLALDRINGNVKFQQQDPGFSFLMLTDELRKSGGFHPDIENQWYFSIVPFGVTGYDPDALMYWRRHELQLNKIGSERGIFWGVYGEQFFVDLENAVMSRWRAQFGDEKAAALGRFLLDIVATDYIKVVVHRLFTFRLVDAFRFVRNFSNSPASRRITWANLSSGIRFGMLLTPLGRMYWRCVRLLKGVIFNPIETSRKVLKRIRATHQREL